MMLFCEENKANGQDADLDTLRTRQAAIYDALENEPMRPIVANELLTEVLEIEAKLAKFDGPQLPEFGSDAWFAGIPEIEF